MCFAASVSGFLVQILKRKTICAKLSDNRIYKFFQIVRRAVFENFRFDLFCAIG